MEKKMNKVENLEDARNRRTKERRSGQHKFTKEHILAIQEMEKIIAREYKQYEATTTDSRKLSMEMFRAKMRNCPEYKGETVDDAIGWVANYHMVNQDNLAPEMTNGDEPYEDSDGLFNNISQAKIIRLEGRGIGKKNYQNRCLRGMSQEAAEQASAGRSRGERYTSKLLFEELRKFSNDYGYDIVCHESLKTLLEDYIKTSGKENNIDEIFTKMSQYLQDKAYVDLSADQLKRCSFNFTVLYNNKIVGFVNYDEEQQEVIEPFHPTYESYLDSRMRDDGKVAMSEFFQIPFLQIKKDQVGLGNMVFADFFRNLETKKYIESHTYNEAEEYHRQKRKAELLALKVYGLIDEDPGNGGIGAA